MMQENNNGKTLDTDNSKQQVKVPNTRKPSCRWQTRATLVKSLHGLRKSSGVVSCIASLPIDSVPMVSYYVLCSVCKMRRFGDTRLLKLPLPADLESRVRGHSRSSKLAPFDSLHMVSYYRPIVTLCQKCTVFEIWRHIGRKSPKKSTYPHLARSFGVTPCEFFDDSYLARN